MLLFYKEKIEEIIQANTDNYKKTLKELILEKQNRKYASTHPQKFIEKYRLYIEERIVDLRELIALDASFPNSINTAQNQFEVKDITERVVDFDNSINENLREQNLSMSKSEISPTENEKTEKQGVRIFISYSHKDEAIKNRLVTHLSALKQSGKISHWDDRQIIGGSDWDDSIKRELNTADIILLLISADFIDSKYIWEIEIKQAIERHNKKEARVIPIFCRPCDFKDMPFEKLQGFPKDAKPITTFNDDNVPLMEIAQAIRSIVEGM
jgi:hypothetical protein